MDAEQDKTERQTVQNGEDSRDESGRFTPGNPGGPGRPAGSPNRIPGQVKEDILAAYEERGGIEWLRRLSDPLFIRLLDRLIPREAAADLQAIRMAEEKQAEADRHDQKVAAMCDKVLASLDGTKLMDDLESALDDGSMAVADEKAPHLAVVIAKRQEDADKHQAKVDRARALQARYAQLRGHPTLPAPEGSQVGPD